MAKASTCLNMGIFRSFFPLLFHVFFTIFPHFNTAALTQRGPSFHPGVDPSIFINYESTAKPGNESWLIMMGHGGDCLGPQMNGSEHCDPQDNDWLMR